MSTTDTSTTETVTETAPAETQIIGVSESAKHKVAELLTMEGNPDLALRIAVRPGGCSGYSYEMFFDSDIAPDDIRSTYGQVRVVVDPASAQLLTGATLEYKDGLQGAGFSIDNPNAQRSCGCGQSFS
ncbi:MAG: iron-sulfur cluster insertion protein ErpA [Actinomycetota bacterium]|nr:iron-sulfur cluster insertion protein ErpA [Actinomycetota bacterium]